MAYKPVQLIEPHRQDCWMLNGLNGENPWCSPEQISDSLCFSEPPKVGRDLTGRRNPKAGHTWVVMRCSDPQCGARLAIYWPHFEAALELSDPAWKETGA